MRNLLEQGECTSLSSDFMNCLPKKFYWTSRIKPGTRGKFYLTTTISGTVTATSTSPELGLSFRADTGGFYAFLIDPAKATYAVYEQHADKRELLISAKPSPAVRVGGSNTLEVVGQDSRFYLFINDQPVDVFSDSSFLNGFGGIAVRGKDSEQALSNFSNFSLRQEP